MGKDASATANAVDWLGRHPSAILLAVQLLGVLLYPLFGDRGGRALFGAFGILVLALTVWVINVNPGVKWVGWLLAALAVVLSLLAAIGGHEEWLAASFLLQAVLYLYAAGALTAYMLDDNKITVEDLFAIGATFTLLAWGFAFAYAACQLQFPGSFAGAVDPERARTWMELLFLSFTTLSSTGLSDVFPLSPAARAVSMLEMFAGVMFMALVVSRLVGLIGARGVSRTP